MQSTVRVMKRMVSKHHGKEIFWQERPRPRRLDMTDMLCSFGQTRQTLPDHISVVELKRGRREDTRIRRYFANTNDKDNPKIGKIWGFDDHKRRSRFEQNGYHRGDNVLLWHGTKRHNLTSILTNGLEPSDGSFGSAVYLADRAASSVRFTDQYGSDVLLLCQASVGSMFLAREVKTYRRAPFGNNSVLAIGREVPYQKREHTLGNCRVPSGPSVNYSKYYRRAIDHLDHNEYVVYNPDRVLVKYIVQLKW